MAEVARNRIWLGRGAFVATAGLLFFVALLPLDTLPRNWAGPDLLLVMTLLWAARRPDHAPLLLIAAVFLLADFLQGKPPGLWTALVVILTEALRSRAAALRSTPFMVEWVTVGFGVAAITIAYRFAHIVTLIPQAPARLTIMQAGATILAYPIAVGLAYAVFGINRPVPGEIDAFGRPL